MLWNRRLCGVVNERQGHCLRPSSAHPPTAFHAKGPALSLSLCVSVDTSTPRGRNLSITSLRHVPGPIHSSEKRDERVVANGQRRHVDAAVVPEAEFLLRTRDAGVKMRWMDRNVSFDCSIFFSSSSSPRDRRRENKIVCDEWSREMGWSVSSFEAETSFPFPRKSRNRLYILVHYLRFKSKMFLCINCALRMN